MIVPYRVKNMCNEAASSCCEAADPVKIVTSYGGHNQTVGLQNECKCDFWLRFCEETRGGDDCDYAAEYCCGDYRYHEGTETFSYLNSPLCYCDFFNYAQNEFGHTLKPKALNINKEFSNPCRQDWYSWSGYNVYEERSLEAIYNATNGQNWTNNDGWMNETVGRCKWYGISCDDDGLVTGIDLKDNNLVGKFPVYTRKLYEWGDVLRNDRYQRKNGLTNTYSLKTVIMSNPTPNDWTVSKYGLASLHKLKTVDLAENKLTGTIEYAPLYNLHSLTHFDVSGNQFSGEVEALVTPSLTYADFSNNNFTSMRRFQKYKDSPLQTLRYCDVSNNAIQEDANNILENIPPNIEQFIASNNQIYGNLPESLNNLQKLRQFNMASNALSGELRGFTESFATLQELDLFNQTKGVTGPIPEDIWRSLSLKMLNLAGNRLTGTISSLVGNLAVLEVFDLSNNLLESSIPAEIGMLEGE
jgi:Leucine-rich repeat (LRR) protein